MRIPRRWLPLTLVALVVVVVAVAGASGGVRVVGNCFHSQLRPASIVLACADANLLLSHLRWTSFGGSVARGSGDYSYNDCNPYCAAGHFHSYPITVVLSRPKTCPDGHRDYQLATAEWSSSSRPPGSLGATGKPGKLSLFCPLKA